MKTQAQKDNREWFGGGLLLGAALLTMGVGLMFVQWSLPFFQ